MGQLRKIYPVFKLNARVGDVAANGEQTLSKIQYLNFDLLFLFLFYKMKVFIFNGLNLDIN